MKKIEHTPEPWSVDRTDDYGSYRIHEAAKEQNQWVDEGYDLSEEEGERPGAIAEQHDEGNRLLIEVAPQLLKLVRSIWESRYTDGGEDIGVPANGYTVRLNAEQCDIIRQIITKKSPPKTPFSMIRSLLLGKRCCWCTRGWGFIPIPLAPSSRKWWTNR